MNLSELVTATSTSNDVVSGTITAAADTLLVCIVAAEVDLYQSGTLVSTAGWTKLSWTSTLRSSINLPALGLNPEVDVLVNIWWKAVTTAGDSTIDVTWTTADGYSDSTPYQMVMHLLEVGGGAFIDDQACKAANDQGSAGEFPDNAADSAIAVSREGNLGIFALLAGDVAANLSPPAGYTVGQETDSSSGRWCLATYYKVLPYATYYEAQATTSTAKGDLEVPFALYHLEADVTVSPGALMGDF